MSTAWKYQFPRRNATKEKSSSGNIRSMGSRLHGSLPNVRVVRVHSCGSDYVSKWVAALPCVAADSKSSKKIFQEIIFPRFRVPRVVISDGGSHFINKTFRKCLSELGVDHRVATPYHPQTSGQAETSNKQIKNILQKTVNAMGKGWKSKFPEALWAYRTAFKTPIGMTPYQLVYGKTCHLLVEL